MNIRGILIDLDGVIYESGKVIPGAIEVIRDLQSKSFPHLFVTNTTSKPRGAIVEKLQGMGVQVTAESILTPVIAAVSWIKKNKAEPAAVYVPSATLEDFSEIKQIENDLTPKSVVMGDLGAQFDFALMNKIFRQLQDSADTKLLALGMTRYWRAQDGLRLDVGPFVKALEYASSCEVLVLGKPAALFFEQAANMLEIDFSELAMIGDDIQSDVLAAQRLGIQGILVKTGKFTPRDLQVKSQPDHVIDSVVGLPRLLGLS